MNLFKTLWNSQTIQIRLIAVGILLFLFLIAIALGGVRSCVTKKRIREDKQNQKIIEQIKGKLEIIEQEKQNANTNIKKSDETGNNAAVNFNISVRRDSSFFNSNFQSAKAEYCNDNPNDTLCR